MPLVSSKDPSEVVPLTFDFSSLVDSIDSATFAISVTKGVDASAAAMLVYPYSVAGASAIILVRNGIHGNLYRIRCDALHGTEHYALVAELPVKTI